MTQTPTNMIDIFLQPGEFFFGDRQTRIRTLLGSCVSITMWHPKKLIGGMCHFLLPTRADKRTDKLDGRYGDEAVLLFFREAVRYNSHPAEYVIKVFGGGKMFPAIKAHGPCRDRPCEDVIHLCRNVSCRNATQSIALLKHAGLSVDTHDLGGTASRNIIFDVSNGKVWVRKNEQLINAVGSN
jgi:chemotaxis protein CheD